jgi:hypothetical protein
MAQQIQLRNDTTAGWEYANPVLAQAEIGVDTTLGKFKIGNGTSTWSQLQFQSASVADFVFLDDGGDGSYMTVTDHDMTIQTVRDEDSVGSDCDINIEAADDVFIRAYGDEVGIYASSNVVIRTDAYDGLGTGGTSNAEEYEWKFNDRGQIEFPDGTIQTTSAQGIVPLPDFLNWREGTTHLPELNTNFGWNSDGLWFQNAQDEGAVSSYPIYTDFTVAQNEPVIVEFDFDANTECNDIGVCVYVDGTTPQWDWSPNTTRIAAQFDCFNLELVGRTTEVTIGEGEGIPGTGIYTVTFTYNPTASTDKVTVSYKAQGSNDVIASLSLNEALPTGRYRVGFAADQSSSSTKTYMSDLSIDVNNEDDFYSESLQNGNSGFTSDTDLVIPVAIKDDNGDDFITFTRTSTGTARIESPQDDLSLRSARDITLFAGEEGPGNVYIGWGDADLTPDATNRVATIGDIQSLTTGNFEFNNNVMSTEGSMNIEGMRENSSLGATIELDPNDGRVSLYGYTGDTTDSYSTTDWTGNATWSSYGEGGSQVVLAGATALVTFLNETFNQQPARSVSINGSDYYEFDGMSGNSENVTIYTITGAPLEPTTVTSLEFRYQTRSVIEIDEDDEEILLEGLGLEINLKSTEGIRFTSNLNADSEYSWQMANDGRFQLPGAGYIENVVNGASDGNGGDTIELVPDATLGTDQYLIIEPTNGFEGPDHIHIRAGGAIDESAVNLILGGEKNAVVVSDDERAVGITTGAARVSQSLTNLQTEDSAEFVTSVPEGGVQVDVGWKVLNAGTEYTVTALSANTPTEGLVTITATGLTFGQGSEYTFYYDAPYVNTWAFTPEGYLYGPAMGGLYVTGVVNNDGDIYVASSQSVVLQSGDGGEFLDDPNVAGNQIAKLSDRAYVRTTVPTSSIGVDGHVIGMVADDATHHYYCIANYDGTTHIWKRVAWINETWGV